MLMMCPDIEAVVMMAPPRPCSTMARAAAWAVRKTPVTLVSWMRWKSSSDMSSIGVTAMTPALQTAMSIPPNSAVTRSTMLFTSSCWVTSQRTGTTFSPAAAVISSATFSNASKCRAAMATWAPAWAYASATRLPMPLDPPVTRARLPCKSNKSNTLICPYLRPSSVSGMGKFPKGEIEQAVGHYTTVAEGCSASGDWRPFADLFTEDVVYTEHHYGVFHGREAVRDWIVAVMAPFPHMRFPSDWT